MVGLVGMTAVVRGINRRGRGGRVDFAFGAAFWDVSHFTEDETR